MSVAAEHRYQKLNRQQIDGRKPSRILSLEQEVTNLTSDNDVLKREIAALRAQLITVAQEAETKVKEIQEDADKRCKHSDINHEFMLKWKRMFDESERGHKKASAVLMCLRPDVLEAARQDAKIYHPELWKDKA